MQCSRRTKLKVVLKSIQYKAQIFDHLNAKTAEMITTSSHRHQKTKNSSYEGKDRKGFEALWQNCKETSIASIKSNERANNVKTSKFPEL